MSSPRVSLVVRCYNEREHIAKLLHGVFHQTVRDVEVILVDSGSTDGTLEVARQYPLDEVVYIAPEEFSFGRALNYGIEAASGEVCVIASAHVYPRRVDWLECLLEGFEEGVALVYGNQRGNETTKFSEKRVLRRWFPDHDRERQESPFCNNANAAIRREVWEEFRYDEELTGLEDLEWAKRVQGAGYDVSYAADAEIVHVHDETPREIMNRYRREAFAHKRIIDDQTFTFLDFLYLFALNTVSDYAAAAREGSLLENLYEIPMFRLMQFFGTYRGFARDESLTERLYQRFYYPDREGYPDEGESAERGETDERAIDYSELHAPSDD